MLWVLFGVGCLCIVVDGAAVAIKSVETDQGWLIMAAAAVLILASQLDRVTELSFAGATAKLQEKLAEADATLGEARELLEALSKTVLTDLIANDFAVGMPTRNRFDLHDEILGSLRSMGLSRAQLENVDRDWRRGVALLFTRLFDLMLNNRLDEDPRSGAERHALAAELRDLADIRDNWMVGTPNQYRSFFRNHDLLSEEIGGWISDFEHYNRTGDLRRRDQFIDLVSDRARARGAG